VALRRSDATHRGVRPPQLLQTRPRRAGPGRSPCRSFQESGGVGEALPAGAVTPCRGRCRLAASRGCSRRAVGGWCRTGVGRREPSRAEPGRPQLRGRSPRSERGPLPVRRPAGLLGRAAGARRVARRARGCVRKRPWQRHPPRLGTWAVIARGCCVSLFISFSEFLVVFIFLFIFGLALCFRAAFNLGAAIIWGQPELA